MLTAIVIGFALQAFLLALAWRSWTLDGHDDVEDDIEDRRLAAERRRQHPHGRGGAPCRARADAQRRRRSAGGPAQPVRRRHEAGAVDEPPRSRCPRSCRCSRRGARAAVARAGRRAQRAISIAALTARSGMSIALLVDADRNGPPVARIGGVVPARSASAT